MGVRRAWWALLRRWWALAALVLAGAALCVRLGAAAHSRAHFPRRMPAAVAHRLADFNLLPHVGSWRVQSDVSNHTSWRYAVTFDCGAWCRGEASVTADELHAAGAAPQHGPATAHAVRLTWRACSALPLLPWLSLCEELETNAVVRADGAGGARLEERASARCAAPLVLSGACARSLRRHRDEHLQRLRLALA